MRDWTRLTYRGRRALLATMHGKERAIAPVLYDELGLHVEPVQGLDTDQFGTFSGEITRRGSPLDAARAKIAAAFALAPEVTIGLASEGSFGPDPALPFFPLGSELVLLVDRETGVELTGTAIDHNPNFNHVVVSDVAAAIEFAERSKFPEHGLILLGYHDGKPAPQIDLCKNITDMDALRETVEAILWNCARAFIQTDMRAHRNPTRMHAIADAARDLVRSFRSQCPACGYPGYGTVRMIPGLPCAWCGQPTRVIRAELLGCRTCGHREERPATDAEKAQPDLCDFCNP